MTDPMTERDAIHKLKQGNIRGLETLVRKYQVQAVRATDLITRDQALAEDIVQAAFLRAFERIDQFDESRPFGPWFLRSVINEAVKTVTRRLETPSLDTLPEISPEEIWPAGEPEPEEWVEQQETYQQVWEALGQLSPEQRAVIVLRYYLELSLEEIGEEVAAPSGTIKWRLHKARMRLKKILEQTGD
ncbi:MAG: sigma-70 family RNA polymerase sigma factor [Anaerolineales bacterium]|jgi:RNA polymerase sigma-70 factor (ECF subfamily)